MTPYKEGDWFAIPLRDNSGFAHGIVARSGRNGILLGYFFGPREKSALPLDTLCAKGINDSILIGLFGDLSLITHEWPIIGSCANWEKQNWSVPNMIRIDAVSNKRILIKYDDDLNEIGVISLPDDDDSVYPRDVLMGSGSVEIKLTKILSS